MLITLREVGESFHKSHFRDQPQNCTLQLNFKAQLLLIKIQLINAESQIQPTWHHLLPEKLSKSETFNDYFRTVLVHF